MYWGYAAPDGEKNPRYNATKATEVSVPSFRCP